MLKAWGEAAVGMLAGGFELAARILAFPKPMVMACTGHAIAMGSFLLRSGDHLIGSAGHRVMANEVPIGLTMPRAALAIMHYRLTPATYQRVVALAAAFVGVFDSYTQLLHIADAAFEAAFAEVFGVNVKSALLLARAAAPSVVGGR